MGPRHRLTTEERQVLRELHSHSGDYVAYARRHGISRAQMYRALTQPVLPKPPRSVATPLLAPERVQAIVAHLEANRTSTLEDLRAWCGAQGWPVPSKSTLSRRLKGELMSFKRTCRIPFARNSAANLTRRREYATWLSGVEDDRLIYIDEVGFSVWDTPQYGWSRVGTPCPVKVCSTKVTRVTVCAAISLRHGLITGRLVTGGFKSLNFGAFLENLASECRLQGKVLVYDNCNVHSPDVLDRFCLAHECEHHPLPPYSPMLNPIEESFSCLKHAVRAQLGSPEMRDRMAAIEPRRPGQKTLLRLQVLIDSIQVCFTRTLITPAKCEGWFRHARSYLPACLREEPIE